MINSVIVIGHLGQDPEVKYNDDGTPIARFSVACNEVWSNNGQKKERTHWFKCVAFGKLAELTEQYLKKGSRVGIHGALQYRAWDENGSTRSTIEIKVRELQFLSTPENSSEEAPSNDDIPF